MKTKKPYLRISSPIFITFLFLFFGVFINKACAGNMNTDENDLMKIERIMDIIKRHYVDKNKIDEDKLINGAIKGMLEALDDPYTLFLSEKDMEELQTTSTGKFGGVGMIISKKDNYIVVVSPIEDTPAFRKGMKSGDLLTTVDGESLKGLSVNEAANKLKGKPGTSVSIEFLRDEVKFETELVRAIIDVPTVKQTILKDRFGYLRITQFAGTTAKHVKNALEDFKKQKVEGIIVDLRYNPGGLLTQVVKIVDYFQDKGVIVSTKGRKISENVIHRATKFNTIVDSRTPIIVLIDNASASASEIFSGAIKDLERGILIGEKTYGKGSVQTIGRIDNKVGFKMTISKYYTPNDISIDNIGIEPHLEVKEKEFDDEEKESLKNIFKKDLIEEFTQKNSNPTQQQIDLFIEELKSQGYKIRINSIQRMIKNAINLGKNDRPIVDLEYDQPLIKAIDVLEKKQYAYENGKFTLLR